MLDKKKYLFFQDPNYITKFKDFSFLSDVKHWLERLLLFQALGTRLKKKKISQEKAMILIK